MRNSGFSFPLKRITVNLAPAELKKEGASYDLPIAVALLIASEQLAAAPGPVLFLGELSLDGTLRHSDGILCMVLFARDHGYDTVFVPEIDGNEAALVDGVQIIPVPTLALLVAHLRGDFLLAPATHSPQLTAPRRDGEVDLVSVRGQEHARRAQVAGDERRGGQDAHAEPEDREVVRPQAQPEQRAPDRVGPNANGLAIPPEHRQIGWTSACSRASRMRASAAGSSALRPCRSCT